MQLAGESRHVLADVLEALAREADQVGLGAARHRDAEVPGVVELAQAPAAPVLGGKELAGHLLGADERGQAGERQRVMVALGQLDRAVKLARGSRFLGGTLWHGYPPLYGLATDTEQTPQRTWGVTAEQNGQSQSEPSSLE